MLIVTNLQRFQNYGNNLNLFIYIFNFLYNCIIFILLSSSLHLHIHTSLFLCSIVSFFIYFSRSVTLFLDIFYFSIEYRRTHFVLYYCLLHAHPLLQSRSGWSSSKKLLYIPFSLLSFLFHFFFFSPFFRFFRFPWSLVFFIFCFSLIIIIQPKFVKIM